MIFTSPFDSNRVAGDGGGGGDGREAVVDLGGRRGVAKKILIFLTELTGNTTFKKSNE